MKGNLRGLLQVISGSLALVMLAGAAVGCAGAGQNPQSEKITVASSDAEKYAEWLDARLTEIPDDVVLGVGGSNAYGVDMSNFEDDGYIIKNSGEEVVIFGKTEDGLDRGVRKYANTVDLGEVVKDTAYHEGYRIEKLTLFGADISEFSIVYPEENNANMVFAAEELQRLVRKACGAELSIAVGSSDSAHLIELRHTEDETLRDDGYRYFEEDGNLVIEGAVARGCLNGVYRFLQNECGWEGLIFGDSYLLEADHINIETGLRKSETPIFDYMNVYSMFWGKYNTDRTEIAENSEKNSYGPISIAMHGMTTYEWADIPINNHTSQICYTSESIYKTVLDNVIEYIEDRREAGAVPGVTLREIDISQGDNNRYCLCSECSKIVAEEKSNSGPVVRFANKLADDINDLYPGTDIAVKIFAYFSTKKPPAVTKANEHVYVSYCQNGNCSNHYMDGSQCTPMENEDWTSASNITHSEWLEGWCEMAENVYVWYYALDSVLQQYTILDNIKADFTYMKNLGVKGLFWQIPYHGFGIKRVEHQLGYEFNWVSDMTDEEFEAELCRILEWEYGDGWKFIREYIDLWNDAQDRIDYFHCWIWANPSECTYNTQFMRENYHYMTELLEKAIKMAGSEEQEERCRLLSCHVYYEGIYSSYFRAYEAEDAELLKDLSNEYDLLIDRIRSFDEITSIDGYKANIYETLEEEAWLNWVDARDALAPGHSRPAPEWVNALETAEETA